MELTPAEIRRPKFEQIRRGYDPQEVGLFLERVSETVAERDRQVAAARAEIQGLERALEEARGAEEAVRLTMMAATRAKDEILAGANEDAGHLLHNAQAEAEAALTSARREALLLIEESRRDADELAASAKQEHATLLNQINTMRDVTKKASNLLKGMAAGALSELGHAGSMLDDAARPIPATGEFEVVVSSKPAGATSDPIDRLLDQLREAGG